MSVLIRNWYCLSQDELNKELYNAAEIGDKEKAKMHFKITDVIPYHFRITKKY